MAWHCMDWIGLDCIGLDWSGADCVYVYTWGLCEALLFFVQPWGLDVGFFSLLFYQYP